MLTRIFKCTDFHKDLFINDKCIIDIEISNDISADWDYVKGKPIVVGFLHNNDITIFISEDEKDIIFEESVLSFIHTKLKECGSLYAFNKHMERGNLLGMYGIDIPIKEIKPFKARGWNKDKFYLELIGKAIIPDTNVADVFQGDASLCIKNWQNYIYTRKIEYVLKIAQHNINCLLKESAILKNHNFFKANYNINKRGWLEE